MTQFNLATRDGWVLSGALGVSQAVHFLLQQVDVIQHHSGHLVDQLSDLQGDRYKHIWSCETMKWVKKMFLMLWTILAKFQKQNGRCVLFPKGYVVQITGAE